MREQLAYACLLSLSYLNRAYYLDDDHCRKDDDDDVIIMATPYLIIILTVFPTAVAW